MDLIIQPEEVGILARPISQHIDREQLVAYITEVEQLQIRSALGGVLFSNIKQSSSAFAIILNGGIDECGEVSGGIRKAVAYYVYARIIREGGTIPTRWGAVEKNDEYATRIDQERKNTIHRECTNIADTYMAEVINYSKAQGWMTTEGINQTRRMAYVVGDGTQTKAGASGVATVKTEADIVQGEGILINGNIVSVDFSSVASMGIVTDVEAKADEAKVVAAEAQEIAERAFSRISDNTEAVVEALTKANNAEKKATATNTALTDEVNERKAEDAKAAKTIAEHTTAIIDSKEKVAKNTANIATNKADIARNTGALANQQQAIDLLVEEVATKQQELTLTVLDNGNIRIGNLQGQTKDFMPATPSGDPMHEVYKLLGGSFNQNAAYNNGADIIKETFWESLVDDADYNAKWGINVIPNNATFVKTSKFNGVDREIWEFDNPLLISRKVWAVAEYASDGTKIWDDKVYVSRGGMWSLASLGDLTNTDMRKILQSPYVLNSEGACGSDIGRVVCKNGTKSNAQLAQYFLNGQKSEVLLFGYIPSTNATQSLPCKAFVPYKNFDMSHNVTATAMQYCKMACLKSVTLNIPKISARSIIYMLNEISSSTLTITFPSALYDRLMDTSTTLGAELIALLETKSKITFARGE